MVNSHAKNSYIIGDINISPNVVLAPMEGVTDLSFRRTIRRIGGVGLTCTEFVPASSLHKDRGQPWETVKFDKDESPVSVQIYGKNPKEMAEGARVVESTGADICDINMGCPSKRVCSRSGGSALMREPDLAREIVSAVRSAVSMPVTVKMRSGFDHTNRNAAELAYMCQEEGANAVTIHWRTREDRYGGQRDVTQIAEAVDRLSIPVIGNGDIVDIDSHVFGYGMRWGNGWQRSHRRSLAPHKDCTVAKWLRAAEFNRRRSQRGYVLLFRANWRGYAQWQGSLGANEDVIPALCQSVAQRRATSFKTGAVSIR